MKNLPLISSIPLFILACLTVFVLQNCGQKEEDKKADSVTEQAEQAANTTIVTGDTQAANSSNQPIINKTDSVKKEPKAVVKKEQEPVKKEETTVIKPISPDIKPVTESEKLPEIKVPEPVKPVPEPKIEKADDPKPAPVVTKPADPNKWIVPAKYINMANPYPADKESLSLGKSLFATHCKSCHGSKGDGNGTKAASLDTKVGSFLTSGFQSQKPGEVYYKSVFGRGDMPKYEKKIPNEDDRWAIVNYILSLK
ncbi:MAG: cytochrome c [Bacteroidia bacterium]|nr:cytochrome c [Bacteroidia bacterium]